MITEQQRINRRNHIGSSDVSALFTGEDGKSLNPFSTALDIWCEKYYNVTPLDETDAMARGNRYEASLIEFARDELGCQIVTDPEKMNFVCKDHPVFACNLDGIATIDGERVIIEAKTTSMAGEYGLPGTDDVPFNVNLQVHQQMLCTGLKKAYVVALLGGFRLHEEIFEIDRDERIIKAITDRGTQFWNDHVLTGIRPPQNEPGSLDMFKRIIRVPETFAEVPDDVINLWSEERQARLDAEKAEKAAFAVVLEHLGDAEGAHLEDGRTFTYFEQAGADKLDRKELKQVYPAAYDAVSTPNRYRVARIKKA